MKSRYVLSDEEKRIEGDIESYVSVKGKKRERIENILGAARKSRAISLRIAGFDLDRIKEKAAHEGIPYQTLITSVLHKYVTNQLYDRDEMLKSIRLLKQQDTA